MAKRTVTIENLAGMVKRGFDEVTADTTVLKKKVSNVATRVENISAHVENIETRVENIERLLLKQHSDQLRGLESRVKRLEQLYEIKFQED